MLESVQNLENSSDMIVSAIAHAYEMGILEDPNSALMFTSLLALLCEGKVTGHMKEGLEHLGPVWKLTPEYEEELENLTQALQSENVVMGPWQ